MNHNKKFYVLIEEVMMVKKIVVFSILMGISSCMYTNAYHGHDKKERKTHFTADFTTGYVFKYHDHIFKEVYGRGIENIITADFCYNMWRMWGLGIKTSYWRAKGHTTFFKKCTLVQEVPLTFYIRKSVQPWKHLGGYVSLGGGAIFVDENNYLGHVRRWKGIGEAEIGLDISCCRWYRLTGAFRVLFPRDFVHCQKIDAGGLDLRGGIGFTF